MEIIKKGSSGNKVADIQTRLSRLGYSSGSEGADGVFGELTEQAVKNFQQDRGLFVDGKVSEVTWKELTEATYTLGERSLYLRAPFFRGEDVRKLQVWLNTLGFSVGAVDGVFGPATETAVRQFQKNSGLVSDGIVGFSTLNAFSNLRRILQRKAEVKFPKVCLKPSFISIFKQKKVVIDFESELCKDLALRLGNLLELLGGEPLYTRLSEKFRNLQERVRFANRVKADLFVSFCLNSSGDDKIGGSTTYYFAGRPGKKLGQAVQKELVTLLEREDGGVQGKDLALLKETKMPAIIVSPVYITHPDEEKLLKEEAFRQKIAVAVFDGIKNFLESS